MAAGYGLVADDWQADWVTCTLCRKRDGRWAAAISALVVPRQNGKNGGIEILELFGMVALGLKFLHTAHEVKTARKAFRRIASFFENEREHPELAALVTEIRKTNGQEAIVLRNGGSIEFIARSRGSGRGFTVDVLVCDEVQELTDDELAALLPTISAAPSGNPMVILTGTPPDPEKPDAPHGEVIRRVRSDAQAGRDKTLCFIDFGVADGPLPDVDDRQLWRQVNPALGGRLNIAEVVRERSMMSPEVFARERLGWWGDPDAASSSAFGEGKWAACKVDDLQPVVHTIAAAVAWDRQHASIGCAGMSGDLMVVGSVKRQPGTVWLVDELFRLQEQYGCAVVVDEKGPTADLIPAMRAVGVNVTTFNTAAVADATASIYDRVQERSLAHPGHSELDVAVSVTSKRDTERGFMWARKVSAGDISMLEAVTLAAWNAVAATPTVW